MNRKIVITALLLGISSLAVAADSGLVKVCELLQAQDMAPWGYGAQLQTESKSDNYDKAQTSAPSDVHADICILHGGVAKERNVTTVIVESFSDDTSAEAVANWIKAASAKDKEPDWSAEEVQVGDATCESGKYNFPAEGQPVDQYYVACDRLVGTRHLMVNIQEPEEAKLPTPLQVKGLLDQAAARLALPGIMHSL